MRGKKLNGNDYAWDILKRNAMDARALLKASHNQESVWLELKADPFCRRDCPNGPTDEAIWHTLKAIVAMVNTRGGCVVFGLQDEPPHSVFDLCGSSGKPVAGNTLDEFHRDITEMFLKKTRLNLLDDAKKKRNEKRKGQTPARDFHDAGKESNEQCENQTMTPTSDLGDMKNKGNEKRKRHVLSHSIERYCELKAGVYCDGKPLSVLLVRPSEGEEFVWVTVDDKDKRLIVRQPGDQGRCKYLEADEIRQWTRLALDFDDVVRDKKFDNMFSPVPEFLGRSDVLERIEQCFMRADQCAIPLLYGPAGVGKSEVAYKYAAERNADYDTLIRVDASRCISMVDVFSEIVANPDFRRVLDLEGHYDAEDFRAEDRLMFVREAIAEGRLGRVLMVLDDVRHPDVVRPSVINRYLGRIFGSGFNIIATTRYPLLKFLVGEMVEPIAIGPLLSRDGVKLLARKREIPRGQDSDCAEAIVRLVGGNPWAIDLVGEYLKQKQRQDASDYKYCLQELQKGLVDFFPPKEHGITLAGNATGITDVDALLGPTLSAMRSEERDICTLIAMAWKSRGPERALRRAFEYLYGRNLQDDEWRFYVETLKKKCLVCESANEFEANELYLNDSISAEYFKAESKTNSERFENAFLEYILMTNRLTPVDEKCAKNYLDFVMRGNSSKERKVAVVFDNERCGWPFYVMGVDVRRASSSKMPFGLDELADILKLAEGVPSLEADVLEIKSLSDEADDADEAEAAKNIHVVLQLRERIYAEYPIMLGRSYLHAAEMGVGGIIDLRDRIHLLEKAEDRFSHANDCNVDVAKTLRRKAEAYQEYVDYECDSGDDVVEWKNGISNCLYRAKELWPAVFDDLYERDIDIDSYIEDGICPL